LEFERNLLTDKKRESFRRNQDVVVELFADDIVLCPPSRTKLKKKKKNLLKKVNEWAKI